MGKSSYTGGKRNNPIQETYDEAQACVSAQDLQCIVSIGAGKSKLKAFGGNWKEVGKILTAIATEIDDTGPHTSTV